MKIAVATDDRKHISHHFGRALGFTIFEIKDDKILKEEYRENRGKSTGQCGSCDHPVMIENVKDCEAVICYGMGERIYSDLLQNNIKVIVTEEETVKEAIEKYLRDDLKNRIDKLH